ALPMLAMRVNTGCLCSGSMRGLLIRQRSGASVNRPADEVAAFVEEDDVVQADQKGHHAHHWDWPHDLAVRRRLALQDLDQAEGGLPRGSGTRPLRVLRHDLLGAIDVADEYGRRLGKEVRVARRIDGRAGAGRVQVT